VHVIKSITNSVTLFKTKTRKALILRVLRFKSVVPPGIEQMYVKSIKSVKLKVSKAESHRNAGVQMEMLFQQSSWNAFLNEREQGGGPHTTPHKKQYLC
jgi:hypothetical protein